MKQSRHMSPSLRRILAVLVGVALVAGAYWGGEQEVSWAAPGQLPDQQTVPPRPPKPDSPPESPPAGDDGHDRDNDHGDDKVPPPAPDGSAAEDEVPPVQAPKPIDNATNDQAAPVQPPQQQGRAVQDQLAPPSRSEKKVEKGGPLDPQVADLSLLKTVDNTTPIVDETITYRLVVHNSGPGLATDIAVSEPLPAGLVPSLATATRGSYNGQTGEWLVDLIEPGQSLTLTLVVTVTNANTLLNTAEIIAAGQFDPDSTPGNNVASEDDQASALPVQPFEKADNLSPKIDEAQSSQPVELQNAPTELNASTSTLMKLVAFQFGSLMWLYALGLGMILIVGGLFLTSRS